MDGFSTRRHTVFLAIFVRLPCKVDGCLDSVRSVLVAIAILVLVRYVVGSVRVADEEMD